MILKYIKNTSWLLLPFILMVNSVSAQFYNNGNTITLSNDAILYLKNMDLINVDSGIYNNGTIVVEGSCKIGNTASSKIVTSNSDSLIVFNDFLDSSLAGQPSGVLVLKGAAQSIYSSSNILSTLSLQGLGSKTLQSNASVLTNLNLQKGHIVSSSFVFGLDSTATISPSNLTANSFVVGTLYRKRKLGTEDSLLFPIGNSVAEYRPAIVSGIALPVGKYPVFSVATKLSSPVAGDEVSTTYNRIWNVSNPSSASVQHIKLYYVPAEVGFSPASSLVVAQSATELGKYNSIGALQSISAFVKSEFIPTQPFYTIGSSNFLYGNFKVFLEGPFDNVGAMKDLLFTNNVLKDTLLKTYSMLNGYNVPVNSVDRIAFLLIDETSGLTVDTAYAWLLSDGQIRDYSTGTRNYVSFSKALPATKYYVYATHRNHLPASSNSLLLSATKPAPLVYNHDFSKGVYGGGAMYDAGSGSWLLYASDPYKNWKNQTDVVDLTRTWADEDAGTYRQAGKHYYRYTDLDLDGKVNSSDQAIANDHNNKLYYSTLPK